MAAVVALRTATGPEPSKQIVVGPNPTRSIIFVLPELQPAASAVELLTKATLPLVALIVNGLGVPET